jgi:sulfite reductase (ferredoxin)
MPDHYALYVGGDFEGTRLNEKVFDKIPYEKVLAALEPMFALWSKERKGGEGFGDFCHRYGIGAVKDFALGALAGQEWAR